MGLGGVWMEVAMVLMLSGLEVPMETSSPFTLSGGVNEPVIIWVVASERNEEVR